MIYRIDWEVNPNETSCIQIQLPNGSEIEIEQWGDALLHVTGTPGHRLMVEPVSGCEFNILIGNDQERAK